MRIIVILIVFLNISSCLLYPKTLPHRKEKEVRFIRIVGEENVEGIKVIIHGTLGSTDTLYTDFEGRIVCSFRGYITYAEFYKDGRELKAIDDISNPCTPDKKTFPCHEVRIKYVETIQ